MGGGIVVFWRGGKFLPASRGAGERGGLAILAYEVTFEWLLIKGINATNTVENDYFHDTLISERNLTFEVGNRL